MKNNQRDIELIHKLGGPSKVAELIGLDKQGGAQRVQNWLARGIPAQVKVDFPTIFMPELAQAPASHAQPAIESVAVEAAPVDALRVGRVRRLSERRVQSQRAGKDRRPSGGPPYQANVTGLA